MIRAFIAVELEDALRREIAGIQQTLQEQIGREAQAAVRIAWVRPASIHLTLKFLGDIDETQVDPLRHAMTQAMQAHTAVRIPLARLGAFPRPQEPHTLWIGAPQAWERGPDAGRLAALVRDIEACCEPLGVRREPRPFTPHLTLARIKSGERPAGRALARLQAMDRPLALAPLTVAAVALMKSQLNADGAVHTRLWEIPLARIP
jgi:2'-5' RNA ligase